MDPRGVFKNPAKLWFWEQRMIRNYHLPFVLCLVLGGMAGIEAQKSPGTPGQPAAKPMEDKGVARKVIGVSRDKVPLWACLNFKMLVKLYNGRTIVGIARKGRLFEKIIHHGKISDFEKSLKRKFNITPSSPLSHHIMPAKPSDENVGIRLWHHDSTGGYIFLLYQHVESVRQLKIITPAELLELDELARRRNAANKAKIQKDWKAQRQKRLNALKKQQAEKKKAAGQQKGKGRKEDEVSCLGDQELAALFKRFHPARGWTPGRKRVIEWRKWTLGVFPSEDEKEFLNRFVDWKKAYDNWMITSAAEKESGEEEENPKPSKEKPPAETPKSSRPKPDR